MTYGTEFIEAVEKFCKDDVKLKLHMLRELSDSTTDNMFHVLLESEIEKICMKYELCSECFSDLKITKYSEYRGECQGEPAYETMYSRRCDTCGQEIE